MAHHWYDALPVCRWFCIIGDWSPNSSHWKVLKKRNIIQRTISNSLRFARLTWHIWDSTLCCIAFSHILSYGCVLILPFCTSSLFFSPHDPILTGHQALAPSSPMLLKAKSRSVRLEFCFRASARAWQETRDLRNAMKQTAHIIPQSCEKSPHSSSHLYI